MATANRRAAEAAENSLHEMRLARRDASAPRIAVYFASPSSALAEIVMENFGESTATNVTFAFDPPLRTSKQRESVVRFFDTPKTLPPHGSLKHAFDTWPDYFKAELPKRYNVRVRWQRLSDPQVYDEVHVLDAGAFEYYSTWHIRGCTSS